MQRKIALRTVMKELRNEAYTGFRWLNVAVANSSSRVTGQFERGKSQSILEDFEFLCFTFLFYTLIYIQKHLIFLQNI